MMRRNFLVVVFCLLFAASAGAAVRPLISGSGGKSSSKNPAPQYQPAFQSNGFQNTNVTQRCYESGFTMQKCPDGYVGVLPCPLDNKYFKDCCPQDYRFTRRDCFEMGLEPSEETCLGFHACRKKQETTEEP